MDGAGALAIGMPVLSLLAGSRPGSRPTFLLLPECRPQDSRPRTGPHCPRPRSHAAGQPVSWHLRGAPQNSTSRRRRYARTTAASQITKWLCPAAQPPPRKHPATGAATRGGCGYHSGHCCAWPVLQRFASSPHSRGGLLPLILCRSARSAAQGHGIRGRILWVLACTSKKGPRLPGRDPASTLRKSMWPETTRGCNVCSRH